MTDYVEARNATLTIKKMLLGNGGSVHVSIGSTVRILSHSAADRPLQSLPWPFNKLQPRTFRYHVLEGEKTTDTKTFQRGQIDEAIAFLLRGVSPNEQIRIMPKAY
jgi:hypothetical protein